MPSRPAFWPHLERELERLKRKYAHIEDDLIEALGAIDSPNVRKDPVPGYHGRLWKLRIRSRDMRRGAQGGFRLYLYVEHNAPPHPPTWYPVALYAKTERDDLSKDELRSVLQRFFEWVHQLRPGSRGR
jgi:hypothetical protein